MKKRISSSHQIIKTVLLIWLLFPLLSCTDEYQKEQEGLTTIILVRHAEKADDSADPDLSDAGYERAARLAELLGNVEFDAVYSTDYIRTRETAKPLADANNLSITLYDPKNPEAEVKMWMENHGEDTILISGHSNSTPTFANAILGEEHFTESFDESDYGNVLIITISDDGERKLLHLRY